MTFGKFFWPVKCNWVSSCLICLVQVMQWYRKMFTFPLICSEDYDPKQEFRRRNLKLDRDGACVSSTRSPLFGFANTVVHNVKVKYMRTDSYIRLCNSVNIWHLCPDKFDYIILLHNRASDCMSGNLSLGNNNNNNSNQNVFTCKNRS